MAKQTPKQSVYMFVVSSTALFLTALMSMILVGVLHSTYSIIPTVSYWTTVVALCLVRNVYQYVTIDFIKMSKDEVE